MAVAPDLDLEPAELAATIIDAPDSQEGVELPAYPIMPTRD